MILPQAECQGRGRSCARLQRHNLLLTASAALPPGAAGKQQSPLRKAATIVGSVLGVPGAGKGGGGGEESPAAAAARYLGADSVDLTVDTLKGW